MYLNYHLKLAIPLTAALVIAACGGGSESEQPAAPQQSGAEANQPASAKQTGEVPEASYECPGDTLTMIDICLGMPPDQVKAVLLNRHPDIQIRERLSNFSYSDGAQKLNTEAYVDRIRAETESDEYYEFHFTAPPGESKLVHMQRSLGSQANLPPIAGFMDALVDNYGEPTFRFRGEAGRALVGTLRWDFPNDRTFCSEPPQKDSGLVLGMTGHGVSFGNVDFQVEKVRQRGVDDPANCASWLQVYIQTFNETDPVRSVEMNLTDFATGVAEARDTLAWLEQKEAQARADRLKNAEVPDL